MEGIVKAVSPERRGVLISSSGKERWHTLADNVKLSYVQKGGCEFNTNEHGDVVFIKKTASPAQETQETKKESGEQIQSDAMNRMSALKASSRIYESTGKEEEFKKLTDELVYYIMNGKFY